MYRALILLSALAVVSLSLMLFGQRESGVLLNAAPTQPPAQAREIAAPLAQRPSQTPTPRPAPAQSPVESVEVAVTSSATNALTLGREISPATQPLPTPVPEPAAVIRPKPAPKPLPAAAPTTTRDASGTLRPSLLAMMQRQTEIAATAPAPAPVKLEELPLITNHTVRLGDSLANIAIRYYGDRTKAALLAQANADLIPADGKISLGATLRIPDFNAF